MVDYMRVYVNLDTILLAEVMINFIKSIRNEFSLCPTNFISLPHLSFELMLKSTGCRLEQISDAEMCFMTESNIRGGVSFVASRHINVAQALNECLVYVDANNLYGLAQSCLMPYSEFTWLSDLEYNLIDWSTINTEGDRGYILTVDLEYPPELHELHDSLPLAPESLNIFYQDLSPYSQEVLKTFDGEKKAKKYKSQKLSATFNERKEYVVHFATLKYYLSKGMKLKKIHNCYGFRQVDFIRPFIEEISKKRAQATNDFHKSMYKLIINSIYGKRGFEILT